MEETIRIILKQISKRNNEDVFNRLLLFLLLLLLLFFFFFFFFLNVKKVSRKSLNYRSLSFKDTKLLTALLHSL